jgi:hypothetical protein
MRSWIAAAAARALAAQPAIEAHEERQTPPGQDAFDAGIPSLRGRTTAARLAELGLSIPAPSAQRSGSAFAATIDAKELDAREALIEDALLAGHLPAALRTLVPVKLNGKVDGVPAQAVIYVMPDYLSIGTDEDALRIPMWSATAQRVADRFGARLPTTKIVDAIERAANVKLPFLRRDAGSAMESTAEMVAHDADINRLKGAKQGLLAGHKKDTVISNKRGATSAGKSQQNQVVIYGGRFANGARVQPASTWHFHRFSDYSQGIRLLAPKVLVQRGTGPWEWKQYDALLADPKWSALISDEGPIRAPFHRYPTDPYAGSIRPANPKR